MTSKENLTNLSKYKMDHAKRGISLIININKYDPNPFKLEEREWSKRDVDNLKKTLNYLEFDLNFAENLTKYQIKQRLQQIASINHENSDCFLCVVMSHGSEDNIFTSNSELISFDEIMAPIKSCPTLFNKPKMFLFQACRDGKKEIDSKANSDKSTKSSQSEHTANNLEITSSPSDTQSILNKNIETKFENESDLLIYYSTLPSNLSNSGNKEEGSFFIKSFCNVSNDAYKNLPNNISLLKMFTEINNTVSNISNLIYRMRRDVYFLPKNVSQMKYT
jgi:hypothetical protein